MKSRSIADAVALALLVLSVTAVTLPARAAEPLYQSLFFTPETHHDKIWGEPSLTFHEGTYYLIYDTFPHRL